MNIREEILQKIKDYLDDQCLFPDDDFCERTTFDDMQMDSLDKIELTIFLENEYDITIPDSEADWDNFEEVINSVISKIE